MASFFSAYSFLVSVYSAPHSINDTFLLTHHLILAFLDKPMCGLATSFDVGRPIAGSFADLSSILFPRVRGE